MTIISLRLNRSPACPCPSLPVRQAGGRRGSGGRAAVGILAALLFVSLLSHASVWAQPAADPGDSPGTGPEAQDLLDRAKTGLEAGDLEQAQLNYQLLLTTYPDSPLRDQAYFGLAQIERQRQNDNGAVLYYQKLIDEFPGSPLVEPARHELAVAYISLGHYDNAIPILERERSLSQDIAARQSLTDQIVDVYLKQKDRVQAVIELLKKEWTQESDKQAIDRRLDELLAGSSRQELNELVQKFPKGYPGDAALLKLADQYESAREYFEAERELQRFLVAYPRHPAISKARSRIAAIKQRYLGNRYLIGALLPLSGRLKPFGQQVLNGIRLAVDRTAGAIPEGFVDVVVDDTEAAPTALQGGFDELARDYRVSAIIGPMLSRQVTAVGAKADHYRLPLLTPAAAADFSKPWKYVLRNSITNRQQAREIAGYAIKTLNLKRFCILYSEDAYGKEMMRVFSDEIAKQGGEIIEVASYDSDATDFGPQIRHLKEADVSKYGLLGPPPTQKGQIREYKPGFDAIFLPGDYDQVGLIAAQLAFYDIQGVALLGTNGWNSQGLIQIGGRYIDGGFFVDGFFSGSSDPAVRAFVDRYRSRYQEEPTLLAAQAYDATTIVLKALQHDATSGDAIRDFIGRLQNFSGATGPIGYTAEGEITKPLYVIQVKNGKFVQVN